jgi:hypothetical protein
VFPPWGREVREGREVRSELECGGLGLVLCKVRRGAPHIRGAHTKYQGSSQRFGMRGDVFPPRA